MKKIAAILSFLAFVTTTQAQTDKQKSINNALSTYQNMATKYFDEKSIKNQAKLSPEQLDLLGAKRMIVLANFEGIKRETIDKFYFDPAVDLQDVKVFIETNYRQSLKDLPEEFFKKVNEVLKKTD